MKRLILQEQRLWSSRNKHYVSTLILGFQHADDNTIPVRCGEEAAKTKEPDTACHTDLTSVEYDGNNLSKLRSALAHGFAEQCSSELHLDISKGIHPGHDLTRCATSDTAGPGASSVLCSVHRRKTLLVTMVYRIPCRADRENGREIEDKSHAVSQHQPSKHTQEVCIRDKCDCLAVGASSGRRCVIPTSLA